VFAAFEDPEVSLDEAREGEDSVLEYYRRAVFEEMPPIQELSEEMSTPQGIVSAVSQMASVRKALLKGADSVKIKAALRIYLAEYYLQAANEVRSRSRICRGLGF
jgi:hypothetical protein